MNHKTRDVLHLTPHNNDLYKNENEVRFEPTITL